MNSSGLIETLGVNVIAPDYTDAGCPVIKIEAQSTNTMEDSINFNSTRWASTLNTLTSGYLDPSGNYTAWKVSGNSYLYAEPGQTSTTGTRSIWARTVSGTGDVHLCSHNSNSNSLFSLTTTWKRFDVRSANSTGGHLFYGVDFRGSSTLSEVIIWEAQSEVINGDAPTSNITTVNGSATRFADVVSINTSSITGTISSITETIDGVDQTPITTIPATYTMPTGNINKIIMQ
tara:strand:- start:141 stop:836 length:696 start_codon:yes stop_codon:yes gene_type:complete